MPDAESQERSAEDETRDRAVAALSVSFLFGVSSLCAPIQVEPELITSVLYKGDVARAATAIATVSGMSGAVEFALNPTLGRLSDAIGRRPFFVYGPLAVLASNLAVALQGGTNKQLVLANGVIRRAGATFAGSVASMAMLADLCKGSEYSTASAKVMGMAGLGVILGPLSSAMVGRVTSNPRWVYLLAAGFAALQIANNIARIPETRPPPPPDAPRAEFKGMVSPLAFTRLFGRSRALSRLVVAAALVSFVEGKNLNDLNLLWMRNDCGLSQKDIATYVTAWGFGAVASGAAIVPGLLKRLGMRGFTDLTMGTTAVYLLLQASAPSLGRGRRGRTLAVIYAAFALLLPGMNAGSASALKGWATTHANAAGLQAGEFSGYFSNLRAMATTLAPLLYGNLYARYARQRGVRGAASPAVCWVLASALGCALPQLIWRSLGREELERAATIAAPPPDQEPPTRQTAEQRAALARWRAEQAHADAQAGAHSLGRVHVHRPAAHHA